MTLLFPLHRNIPFRGTAHPLTTVFLVYDPAVAGTVGAWQEGMAAVAAGITDPRSAVGEETTEAEDGSCLFRSYHGLPLFWGMNES